jgi:alginate O-acetyltransferase complex protein AlgI
MCGLWHGAGYTFVVWGLYHGFWLAAERMYMTHVGPLPGGAVGWLRTFLTVIVGWVVFRATGMDQAMAMLEAMAGLSSPTTTVFYDLGKYAVPHHLFFALCGLFFALCPFDRSSMRLDGTGRSVALKAVCATAIFCYALALLSANSFNPFIYFRF